MDEVPVVVWLPFELSNHCIWGWEVISRGDLISSCFFAEDMVKLGMEMTISLIKNKPQKIQGGELDNNSSSFIALTHFSFLQYSGFTGNRRHTVVFLL